MSFHRGPKLHDFGDRHWTQFMAIKSVIRVLVTIAAGLVGLVLGAFLGLAFASLITGGGGLHGLDANAIVFLIGGGLVGLFAGTKLGNSFARRL